MKSQKINNKGMTFPELILVILMFSAFTGVTVMVTEHTSRFFIRFDKNAREENISTEEEFRDVLSANYKINSTFDSVIEILSEPGIPKETIKSLTCTETPSEDWGIPSIDKEAIPEPYEICIEKTSLREDDFIKLLNGNGFPGIYILYSKPVKPDKISINVIPQRRIFCRPKPFCKKLL